MFYDFSDVSLKINRVKSTYQAFFTAKEVEEMVECLTASTAYNGSCVRLEAINFNNKQAELAISPINFYDLLTTNLLMNKQVKFLNSALNHRLAAFKDLQKGCLLTNCYLSNAMAVSVMVFDKINSCLVTHRTNNVAISPNKYGVSVTGALDDSDFKANLPIHNCVIREIKEEINIDITTDNIQIRGLFIDTIKCQPTLICDVQLTEIFDPVTILTAPDLEAENASFHLISKYDLEHCLPLDMTQAAEFHMRQVIQKC